MADNVTVDNGEGTDYTASTEELSDGSHLQSVELHTESAGTKTKAGTTSNPLVVDLGSNNDVTVSGTVTANLSATDNQVLDNIDTDTSAIQTAAEAIQTAVEGTLTVSGTVTADSELPAAGVLADNASNPTAPAVGSFGMVWDGATWDRAPGTSTDGTLVNLGTNNDVTVSGVSTAANQSTIIGHVDGIETLLGTIDTDTGAIATAVAAIQTAVEILDNAINGTEMQVDIVSSAAIPVTDNAGSLTVDNAGTFAVQDATVAGHVDGIEALLGTIDADTGAIATDAAAIETLLTTIDSVLDTIKVDTEAIETAVEGTLTVGSHAVTNAGTFVVQAGPRTSGGLSIFRSLDLDETEEEVKATAGQVYGWFISNTATAVRYVKFYNATAATVEVGTTTPVLTIPLPASSASNVEFTNGIAFGTAITVAAVTGVADADNTGAGANEVVVNIFYA